MTRREPSGRLSEQRCTPETRSLLLPCSRIRARVRRRKAAPQPRSSFRGLRRREPRHRRSYIRQRRQGRRVMRLRLFSPNRVWPYPDECGPVWTILPALDEERVQDGSCKFDDERQALVVGPRGERKLGPSGIHVPDLMSVNGGLTQPTPRLPRRPGRGGHRELRLAPNRRRGPVGSLAERDAFQTALDCGPLASQTGGGSRRVDAGRLDWLRPVVLFPRVPTYLR